LSYGELHRRIYQLSAQLGELDAGSRVGVFIENSMDAYVAIYAILHRGCTYVPLSVDDPASRVEVILRDADFSLIVTSAAHARSLKTIAGIPRVHVLTSEGGAVAIEPVGSREAPLYLLYTSGSSGAPKGVAIAADCVDNFVSWAGNYFAISANDRFLAHTRLTFDLSVFNLFLPFLHGASVHIAKTAGEQIFPGSIFAKDITVALLVPRVTSTMAAAGQLQESLYPKLRHVLFCGENLLAAQAKLWMGVSRSIQVHNLYGPTEATVACSFHSLEKFADDAPLSIGRAIPGNELNVADESGRLLDGACEGELIISGKQVAPRGYWRDSQGGFFTHPVLGHAFKTGDRVRRDASGLLYWLSRLDDQVKIKGHRVELGDIESHLAGQSGVCEIVCFYDEAEGEVIAALSVLPSADGQAVVRALKKRSDEKLPAHMRPEKFVVLPSLPKNANGKIDRKQSARTAAAAGK
jgi:amino acid adenylation domain-containing protein